jgi:DNA uptake protein ComE-like DNA-binding protein
MSWKDMFYFSKGERNGIIVLLALILFILFTPTIFKAFYKPRINDFSEFEATVAEFEARLEAMRATAEAERLERRNFSREAPVSRSLRLTPFPFDPNQLPASEWERIGLPAHVVRSIKNFENAGGSFRYKEDVKRIYLISDEMYAQLEPYIELPLRPTASEIPESLSRFSERPDPAEIRASLRINLNAADTTELIQLHGIGPSFSRRIASYRERLGGYLHPDQLLEVFGMDSTRLDGIRQNLVIDTTLIKKINLNQAEWADLVRHPYIDRNIANSLIAIRNQHGPYQSVKDIERSQLINEEVFRKIAPYLSVE